MNISENILAYKKELPENVKLVAISKTKPKEDLMEAYDAGQRIFGENKIQEMTEKWEELPKDIQWHMVGHVQSNKVKYMAPYVSLIHAVHKLKLLKEIDKRAEEHERTIDCLLQIKIAEEDSKFGTSAKNAREILESEAYRNMKHARIIGLMGMATFTDDEEQVKTEFQYLQKTFKELQHDFPELQELSMGMSGDYKIALECGTTMVRIGSSIFGERNYN